MKSPDLFDPQVLFEDFAEPFDRAQLGAFVRDGIPCGGHAVMQHFIQRQTLFQSHAHAGHHGVSRALDGADLHVRAPAAECLFPVSDVCAVGAQRYADQLQAEPVEDFPDFPVQLLNGIDLAAESVLKFMDIGFDETGRTFEGSEQEFLFRIDYDPAIRRGAADRFCAFEIEILIQPGGQTAGAITWST